MNIPEEITKFVNERCGWRKPVHSPGYFNNFKTSKTSCCWGNNNLQTNSYFISVCQPSIRSKGDVGCFLFDFKLKACN